MITHFPVLNISNLDPNFLNFNCIISPSHGPISIQSANWDSFSFSSTIESIEFRANPGLTGQIPTSVGNLKKLQSLVLIDNGLSGGLPVRIGKLTQLKWLVLSGNLLKGKIPESYGDLSELLILDLSRKSLSGSLPLINNSNSNSNFPYYISNVSYSLNS
ncbi:putative leucine-rich repeat domain superfamily [Helianthus annuus]|uniref:Leucine-rich repeat domain superfamily n=1 Tax=Helianthus annuus TaxID=4232 RepID=A0A9K3NKJ6_HELAN|nr:putative leucine-rich repeat domain superfamily [Helianthus annuus]KAJ0561620.1 putative leucine-rich repeat domain superfamily [Helianthus annuus]KAJ0568343.1 putative leucine-rich repeat domain superfamily [Helianthus annuus]KAJ0574684.1 putative leucine-rich repeat domain superfamily [Helianthus annuus]KAJ0739015.1 putative leucine-rich repeat domain superfamily [Helianthus annuus]